MKMTVFDIADAVQAQTDACSGQVSDSVRIATGVSWDSREITPGDLYVALPGKRVDGHDFARSAVDAGAVAVLANRPLPDVENRVPVLVVPNSTQALTQLAAAWRARLQVRIVGLTGSVGKTSTKNLLRDVLSCAGKTCATRANQNNELGVPRTLLDTSEDADYLVVEMGMRGAGQIADLCTFVRPQWGLVTVIGDSHRELLGSRDAIAHAKAELFEALPGTGVAFVNAQDPYAANLCEQGCLRERNVRIVWFAADDVRERIIKCGLARATDAFVWARDVSLSRTGTPLFTLCCCGFDSVCEGATSFAHVASAKSAASVKSTASAKGETESARAASAKSGASSVRAAACHLQLTGFHSVLNACAAAAAGLTAGLSLECVAEALGNSVPQKGRQLLQVSTSGVIVIDDAYNASPDSVRAALDLLSALQVDKRRIAVLGDMGELGDFAEQAHEEVGASAAEKQVDVLICVGAYAPLLAQGACAAGMPSQNVVQCATTEEALDVVCHTAVSGDAVLVKASHFMGFDTIVKGLVD